MEQSKVRAHACKKLAFHFSLDALPRVPLTPIPYSKGGDWARPGGKKDFTKKRKCPHESGDLDTRCFRFPPRDRQQHRHGVVLKTMEDGADPGSSLGPNIVAATVTMFVAATTTAVLRLYTRVKLLGGLKVEDYLILAAWVRFGFSASGTLLIFPILRGAS